MKTGKYDNMNKTELLEQIKRWQKLKEDYTPPAKNSWNETIRMRMRASINRTLEELYETLHSNNLLLL